MKNNGITYQLGVTFFFLGVGLRLVVFFQNRSLFIDEGSLARNIVEKSGFEFFHPLDYFQYAPPLFLVIEKWNTLLLGAHEYALRLWPLIMGMSSLWLLFILARKLPINPYAALVPLLWMALSPLFIRYSTEVKQYSTDVFIALSLVGLAYTSSRLGGRRLGQLMVLGSLAIWLSMPVVFILAGIGFYGGWSCWQQKDFKQLGLIGVLIGVWLLSFGGYYALVLSKDLAKQALIDYHTPYFFPLHLHESAGWLQLAGVLKSILRSAFGFTTLAYFIGSVGICLGLWSLWRTHRPLLLLFFFPILLCFGASAFGYYSLIPRLTLFFIPLIWIIFAFGISFLTEKLRSKRFIVPVMLISILPLQHGYDYLFQALKIEEIRPILFHLKSHYQAGDWVYVDHEAKPAFIFYQDLHQNKPIIPNNNLHLGNWDETPVQLLLKEPVLPQRIWLVYSHLISAEALDKLQLHLSQIPTTYTLLNKKEETGAVTYQYVLKSN